MSDSVWPHRRQSTRLPRPWDSPGKNTGVGCHFLLQCMKVKRESEVTQSCPTLSDPMDCSLPCSSVHGIFQARVLEWDAIAFSKTSIINTKKYVLFIIEDWNAKVESQEVPGVTGKFGLGVQNEGGKRLTEFCQDTSYALLFLLKHNWLTISYWLQVCTT